MLPAVCFASLALGFLQFYGTQVTELTTIPPQPQPLERRWSIWLRTAVDEPLVLDYLTCMRAGTPPSEQECLPKSRGDLIILQWSDTVQAGTVTVIDLFVSYAQTIYRIDYYGHHKVTGEKFVKTLWMSPYGMRDVEIPKAPKPAAFYRYWTEGDEKALSDWLELHTLRHSNFSAVFTRLKTSSDARIDFAIHLRFEPAKEDKEVLAA